MNGEKIKAIKAAYEKRGVPFSKLDDSDLDWIGTELAESGVILRGVKLWRAIDKLYKAGLLPRLVLGSELVGSDSTDSDAEAAEEGESS